MAERWMSVDYLMQHWVPGSFDQPWSWDDEERELWSVICCCCGKPGHYQRALVEYVREFGMDTDFGIMLGNDGRVWDGHHRILAARQLGIEKVPLDRDSYV